MLHTKWLLSKSLDEFWGKKKPCLCFWCLYINIWSIFLKGDTDTSKDGLLRRFTAAYTVTVKLKTSGNNRIYLLLIA